MENMETFHGKVFQYSTRTIFHGLRGQKRTSCPWILSMESMDQIHSPWTNSMEFMEILHGQYLGRLFSGLLWKNWKSSMEARFNTPHGKFSMESIEIHGESSPGLYPYSLTDCRQRLQYSLRYLQLCSKGLSDNNSRTEFSHKTSQLSHVKVVSFMLEEYAN